MVAICRLLSFASKWSLRISRAFLIGNRLSGKHVPPAFQENTRLGITNATALGSREYADVVHDNGDVVQDSAMWSSITLNPEIWTASRRNRGPLPTESLDLFLWNHWTTSTGI